MFDLSDLSARYRDWKFQRWLRKKAPKETGRVIDMRTFNRTWGNDIFHRDGKWIGWLTPPLRRGDVIIQRTVKGHVGRFLVTDAGNCSDPSDMFFATTVCVGYLDGTRPTFRSK